MKRKIGKKLPVSKAIEGKVPVAWEKSKPIPDIPYTTSNQVEDFDWRVENKRNYKVEYKISEEEADVWETNGYIDDLVFGHATLQNVDFEWGKRSRPYRYKQHIYLCEKVNELKIIKTATQTSIVFEMATEFDNLKVEKCKIKLKRADKNRLTSLREAFDELPVEHFDDPERRYNQEIEHFQMNNNSPVCELLKYKLSEEEQEVWGLEWSIPDVVYEHALLQNVEFEWGTWGRPVKIRPDVRGKDVEHQKVKTAEETDEVFEVAKPFPAVIYGKCTILEPERVRTLYLNIKECKKKDDLPNFIYKKPKFYCKTCNEYICNNCFTTECMDHVVQWLGNATFRCESPCHKPS